MEEEKKEEIGIEELSELIKGLFAFSGHVIDALKDGFDLTDLPVILSKLGYDPEVKEALEGLGKIGKEVKDIDLQEGMQLGMIVMSEIPDLLKRFKK